MFLLFNLKRFNCERLKNVCTLNLLLSRPSKDTVASRPGERPAERPERDYRETTLRDYSERLL